MLGSIGRSLSKNIGKLNKLGKKVGDVMGMATVNVNGELDNTGKGKDNNKNDRHSTEESSDEDVKDVNRQIAKLQQNQKKAIEKLVENGAYTNDNPSMNSLPQ